MDFYSAAKVLHLVSMVAWFAGLFYLPRLFVYHVDAKTSETRETFVVMELRLYKFIMVPAMIFTWIGGLSMIFMNSDLMVGQGWLHAKILFVFVLTGFHHSLSRFRLSLAEGTCQRSTKFFRMYNEIPTLLLLVIVILVVFRPF